MGMKNAETRRGPFSRSESYALMMLCSPPSPTPTMQPARLPVASSSCAGSPDIVHAWWAAAMARRMKRSMRFTSFFCSIHASGSKSRTIPAIETGSLWPAKSRSSHSCTFAMPLLPAIRFAHDSSVVTPTGVVIPTPVTTTLRAISASTRPFAPDARPQHRMARDCVFTDRQGTALYASEPRRWSRRPAHVQRRGLELLMRLHVLDGVAD